MSHDEYRRLHAACIAMARQSSLPDIQPTVAVGALTTRARRLSSTGLQGYCAPNFVTAITATRAASVRGTLPR
jgi:hypothetical protein